MADYNGGRLLGPVVVLLLSIIYTRVLCVKIKMHHAPRAGPQDPKVLSSTRAELYCGYPGLPPPDHPFKVVWNHPDNCERKGVHLDLSHYGFTYNRARVFIGEQIQTLYRTGRWPVYARNGRPINSGLPQLVRDTTFKKTWSHLSQHKIQNFTGLAVMDFEGWRPNFITNYGSLSVYKWKSIKLVRKRHPEYNKSMVYKVPVQEWEQGVRRILSAKLAIGQSIMPHGHWGYYHYPRSWGGNSSPTQNNRVDWLWRKATGLYPSIYLSNPNKPTAAKIARVAKEVKEAVRIQNKFSPPNTAIYAYSNLQQGTSIFFQADHLAMTLGVPANMGASGIVLWGSSSYYRDRQQCNRLQHHIRTVLGPFVKNLTQFTSDCSRDMCNGHVSPSGCVHNNHDTLLSVATSKKRSARCAPGDSRFRDYHCRCYSYWGGDCCRLHARPPCNHEWPNQKAKYGLTHNKLQGSNPRRHHTFKPTHH